MKDNVTRCEFDGYKKYKSKLAKRKKIVQIIAILCAILIISAVIFPIIAYLM